MKYSTILSLVGWLLLHFLFTNESQAQRTKTFGIPIIVGYTSSNFLNSTFSENVESGLIKSDFGWHVGLFGYKGYFFWDISYFISHFDFTGMALPIPDDVTIFQHGIRASTSMIVLPKSKYGSPLVGFGYHVSSLTTAKSEEDKAYDPFNLSTSDFFWSAGVNIRISSHIGMVLSYSQSIPESSNLNNEVTESRIHFTDKKRGTQQLHLSLLVTLWGTMTTDR